MTLLGVCGDKNGLWFQAFGIDGEVLEIIYVCFRPLLAAGRQTVPVGRVFGMADNQYDGILRSFLSLRYH